jgi:non-specific serine/threonine protein kinase
LAEVTGLLEEHRLVTVTGPGGSGKTRLAAEVSGQSAARFADGVWLAELAQVGDPAQVPAAVASALGVREQPGVAVADALARVLARQQVLLVLDNCEHVAHATAELCARLLPACDDVRVLATSREPLHVAGEVRYRLAPLALPSLDDLANAARTEAVALFVDRARSTDAHFALDDEISPVVARLVRRLDGMPLAIELAAAWVETLGVTQLLDRLDDRLGWPTAANRGPAERQRSLAATVEWSYRLLDEREQRVFRAVSVFPGPFTLEEALAVAGDNAETAVLRLVDCSLLVPPRTDRDGRFRYLMLETLRAYAYRLLAEAGEQERTSAALARYAVGLAEEAAAGLGAGAGEVAAARWLDAEEATTRQVLAWTTQHDPALALPLAVALMPWCFLRGRLASADPLLRQATEHAAPPSDVWCTTQFWLGWSALYSADLAGALEHFTAVRDAVGDRQPPPVLADCLAGRSLALASMGRTAEALHDGHLALTLASELGYPAGEGSARLSLSLAARYVGDLDGAVQLARQTEQMAAEIPGWIARASGNILTGALIMAGDLAAAERSCATGLARSRDVGDLYNQATGLTHMVILDMRAGRFHHSAAHLRELLQLAMRTGSRIDVLNGLDCSAYLCAATERAAEAVTLWAACAALLRQDGFTEAQADAARRNEPLREARQALGENRAQAAEERGAAMSLTTAAEYALMLNAPNPPPKPPGQLARLSARERELVTLVARGRTDAQIAAQLSISIRTVRSHLDRIRDKTGYRRRADLTRLALTAGLV